MTDDLYYRKLESTSTSDLIDEKGNETGHPEQFDMSIYEEKLKVQKKILVSTGGKEHESFKFV